MNKNIIIGILSLAVVASVVYGMTQKAKADESKHIAEIAQKDAENYRKVAQEQRVMAEKNAIEARKQAQLAEEMLMDCMKSKKK